MSSHEDSNDSNGALHQQVAAPQSIVDDPNSASLIYDRTIKVPKTGYSDHGSHGVAVLPYNIQNGNGLHNHQQQAATVQLSGPGPPGGMPTLPLSSVQMQLQMQQMAAIMQQQQQLQHQMYQTNNNTDAQILQQQMMPPPPNPNQLVGGYPSLVPGSMGASQQQLPHPVSDNSLSGSQHHIANPAINPNNSSWRATTGGSSGAGGMQMNTTSSTGLMQALNAQMAANQAAINNLTNIAASAAGGLVVDQNTAAAVSTVGNDNSARRGSQVGNISEGFLAPGDIRSGKKRVSPSVPLHPSQLQMHHGGVGGTVGGIYHHQHLGANNNLGMNAVVEEEEPTSNSHQPLHQQMNSQQQQMQMQQQLPPPQVAAPQGLLGAALNQSGAVPQVSGLTAAMSGKQPPRPSIVSNKPDVEQPNLHSQTLIGSGEVLTNPSAPSANGGLDNAEGNLIVRQGDILRIPRKNIHNHPPENASSNSESTKKKESEEANNDGCTEYIDYKVVTLLGQGTFAQVFHCIEQTSNKCVAVKIVKNKPAYTRQAAVEIDIFRKLNSSDKSSEGEGSRIVSPNVTNSMTKDSTTTQSFSSWASSFSSFDSASESPSSDQSIIRLNCYFMHSSHLCLVFEMLGPNLYELLKKRQFRGLPIGAVRTLVRQATEGIKLLGRRNVVHCDLKPENILMCRNDVETVIAKCKANGDKKNSPPDKPAETAAPSSKNTGKDNKGNDNHDQEEETDEEQLIKLIDFGSACFEGQTTHTYIQSRFYRSPEVLIGLPYDSAIDIWSLGCVAAELFLGLPILPGVHEHDQLGRILEMIGPVPCWMLVEGNKSNKFFNSTGVPSDRSSANGDNTKSQSRLSWEFKTRQEYINVLTEEEKRSKGGVAKLEQQQTNRYFKKKRLEDIVMHHGVCNTRKEREQLSLFVHFLKGVLDPDPWKRWTAHQASQHPFLTGSTVYRIKPSSTGDSTKSEVKPYDIHWVPPWDASISKRKLLVIQKVKEKTAQQKSDRNRRRLSHHEALTRVSISQSVPETSVVPNMLVQQFAPQGLDIYGSPLKYPPTKLEPPSPAASVTSQMAAMADAMSLERARSNISGNSGKSSPPQTLFGNPGQVYPHLSHLSASLGGVGMPLSYQQLADLAPSNLGRSYNDIMYHPSQIAAQQHLLQASLLGLNNDIAPLLQQQVPPPPVIGAQSFSGAYGYQGMPHSAHYPYVESDLGYALQRPGVVPGMDHIRALRRQSSSHNSNSSLLDQQRQMLSASLSNLSSSTPQNYGVGPGHNAQFQVSMSPGGILLQQLGLQEQILASQAASFHNNTAGAGGIGASLLSQQLEDTSSQPVNYQQVQQQYQQQLNTHSRQSFPSPAMINYGSYHRGYDHNAVAAHLMQQQSASFGEYGAQMHPHSESLQAVNFKDGTQQPNNNNQG